MNYGNKTIEDKIALIESRIKQSEFDIKEYNKVLDNLKSCKQPSIKDLYNGIDKYIIITVNNKEFEHILGGDGRSSPWSEKRTDDIAEIQIKSGYWFNDEQIKTIKIYVASVTGLKYVEIKK